MSDVEAARKPEEAARLDREFAEELWGRILGLGFWMGTAFVGTVLWFMAGL